MMKRIFHPNLAANDAAKVRRAVIANVHVSDARMPVSVPISVLVKTRVMVGRDVTDVTWVFQSRRMSSRPRPSTLQE